jgi:hypothetical protein
MFCCLFCSLLGEYGICCGGFVLKGGNLELCATVCRIFAIGVAEYGMFVGPGFNRFIFFVRKDLCCTYSTRTVRYTVMYCTNEFIYVYPDGDIYTDIFSLY